MPFSVTNAPDLGGFQYTFLKKAEPSGLKSSICNPRRVLNSLPSLTVSFQSFSLFQEYLLTQVRL